MKHHLIKKVRTFSEEHQLLPKGSPLIVGLSGGPDSVALLSILTTLQPLYGYTLIAAHLDHQWRAESYKDVAFCKKLCESLGSEFVTTTADTITLTKKTHSPEDTGRLLRRTYFEALAQKYKAVGIVLGHHYNDQQETFFLRLIRGASISGLAAMKPQQNLYRRPLLECSKDELLAYLNDEGLSYMIDETNDDPRYLRNAIRHQVIPALRDCDIRFDGSFHKTLKAVQETEAYLERVAEETFKHLTKGSVTLTIDEFLATDEFLHHRLLVHWLCASQVPFIPSTKLFDEIMRFLRNSAQEHQVHPSWTMKKKGNQLSIKKI